MQKQPKMVRLGVVLTVTQVIEEPDEVKLRIVLDKPSNGGIPGFC